jgi:hypothetical protein
MLIQGFCQGDAKGPDISTRRVASVLDLRRIVRTRVLTHPDHFARFDNAVRRDLYAIINGQNVGWPQVAIGKTLPVNVGEGIEHRVQHLLRFRRREWPVPKYARQILIGMLHHAVAQPHPVCSVTSYPE